MPHVKDDVVLNSIKDTFFETYKTNIENDEFDKRDLERLKQANNDWIDAFYIRNFKKEDDTLKNLYETLKWRNEFKANDLLEPSIFSPELFAKRGIYVENKDKNGYPLLHFNVKLHKKGEFEHELLCRFLVHHFEKSYKFNNQHQLVIFFNNAGSGYSNMDMDLIKFIVNCLKNYYPCLTAAWKIIKLMLNQHIVNLIRFVDKNSIKEHIDDEELLKQL